MRSLAPISTLDLNRLARLARAEREEIFERHPEWAERYRTGVLFTVLAGDAANHYGSGISGFSEFHLYTFYAEGQSQTFPRIARSCIDFGPSRHGRGENVPDAFTGRRVWLDHRRIAAEGAPTLLDLLQNHLRSNATYTARMLREGTVVFVEPKNLAGLLAWPTLVVAAKSR